MHRLGIIGDALDVERDAGAIGRGRAEIIVEKHVSSSVAAAAASGVALSDRGKVARVVRPDRADLAPDSGLGLRPRWCSVEDTNGKGGVRRLSTYCTRWRRARRSCR